MEVEISLLEMMMELEVSLLELMRIKTQKEKVPEKLAEKLAEKLELEIRELLVCKWSVEVRDLLILRGLLRDELRALLRLLPSRDQVGELLPVSHLL